MITYSHAVSYDTCHILRDVNLTIVGIGNPESIPVTELFAVTFEYDGDQKLPGVNFTVSGIIIGFAQSAGLCFSQISSLTFYNCTIRTGLLIDSSFLSFEQTLFTSVSAVILVGVPARTQIVNSAFINITAGMMFNPIATENVTFELSITDLVFTGGAPPLLLAFDFDCVDCSFTVVIDRCHFTKNHHSSLQLPLALITVEAADNLSFNCTNSTFTNNQVGIIAVTAGDPASMGDSASIDSIHIRNCTFRGNSPVNASVIQITNYEKLQLTMDSVIVDNNTLPLAPSFCFVTSSQPIVVLLQGLALHISNTTFSNNRGTALGLNNVDINIIPPENVVSFIGNVGSSGGAVALLGKTDIVLADDALVEFVNNTAIFGGAIYIYMCAVGSSCSCEFGLPAHFEGNYATSSGYSIYFEEPSLVATRLLHQIPGLVYFTTLLMK